MPELLADDAADVEVVASDTVYDGIVWDIMRERFMFDRHEITREFVSHPGAVAVLALDERERVLLIKQYRHPVRARDWELPAGLLDIAGELPLLAAQRELAEEADLVAADWSILTEFANSPGGSNEVIRVYLARGVSATDEVFERFDEEAGIEARWVPLDELVDAVLARRVQNSTLMLAALAAYTARERGWRDLGAAGSPWPRHPLERRGR